MGKRGHLSRAKRSRPRINRKRGGAFYLTRAKLHGKRLSRYAPVSRESCEQEMAIHQNKDGYPQTSLGKFRHSILKRACYERFKPSKSALIKLNVLDNREKMIDFSRKKLADLQRIKKTENFGAFEKAAKIDRQITDARQKIRDERMALKEMVKGWSRT